MRGAENLDEFAVEGGVRSGGFAKLDDHFVAGARPCGGGAVRGDADVLPEAGVVRADDEVAALVGERPDDPGAVTFEDADDRAGVRRRRSGRRGVAG